MSRLLRQRGVAHEREARTADGMFSVDLALPGAALLARMLACRVNTLIGFDAQRPLVRVCTVQRRMHSQVRAMSLTPLVVGRAGERIALEADGPSHFAANTLAPGGAMLARNRLLAARGWEVISVPKYVWVELNDDACGAWLLQARPLRSSLAAACLHVLCGHLMQGTRLMITPHQLVW